ncbi:MAG: aminotransferase class V-fold PLP-dependent enzyme [Acidobacteria bacterium]|nr:aminotransferase class V-fold PLP-dependent enzyme [Acidobacteriota bacterium]
MTNTDTVPGTQSSIVNRQSSIPPAIGHIRGEFPALARKTFLDAACVSLAPQSATRAIREFLRMAEMCPASSSTQHHIDMDRLREAARPEAARLINAEPGEIALVESTTHALTLAAASIPLKPGDRVLICDLEYLQVAIPWYQRQRSEGIEVEVVHNRDGKVLVEDIASRITPRTRVVAISSVQWSNGFRCDLAALGRLCAERGVWLVVDAVQHLGCVPLDVRATPVDILACGGHKWLNSPFGTGILYIRNRVLGRLRTPIAGYMSLEPPEGGWGNYFQTPSISPEREYRFVDEARKFEVGGTSNYAGAIGLAASLKLINGLGRENIWRHVVGLTDYLIGGLRRLGLRVVTPGEPENRSGIVTFSAGTAGDNVALMQKLLDRRILVSVRYTSGVGGVRVSCHFFNNLEDIDRLLHGIQSF